MFLNREAASSSAACPENLYLPPTAKFAPMCRLTNCPNSSAIYLLYNGILKDRGDLGGNVLNARTLAALPAYAGKRVIFGARNRFDRSKLTRLGIEFRQLPYELTVKSWF